MLYRKSIEEIKKAMESGKKCGYNKAKVDIIKWLLSIEGENVSLNELFSFIADAGDNGPASGASNYSCQNTSYPPANNYDGGQPGGSSSSGGHGGSQGYSDNSNPSSKDAGGC